MKKVFKAIVKAYAIYLVISAISTAALYIYGCIKYGTKTMNWGIKFSFDCYKVTIANMLHHLNDYIKVRKSPYYVLLDDAKDWEDEFN